MKHVMLDLETLGTVPGCVVLSIGAVEFELDGAVGSSFYANLLRDPQIKQYGMVSESATVEWWSKQSDAARSRLVENQRHPFDAIRDFGKWFAECKADFVWSQGLNFDVPIFEVLRAKVGLPAPWKFWNARDTRTVYHMAELDIREINRESTAHDASADAAFQIKCVQAAVAKLKRSGDCF